MIKLESIAENSQQAATIVQSMRSPVWDWQHIEPFQFIFPLAMGIALAQILFGWIMLSYSPGTSIQQRLYGILLLSILGFFLAPFSSGTPWHLLTVSLMTAIPGLFWLFSYSLFDDSFILKRWQIVLVAVTIILPLIDLTSQIMRWGDTQHLKWLLVHFPEALEFILVGMIVFVVARHWGDDLVESRRYLRIWFCGINGVILLGMLLIREFFSASLPWLINIQYLTAAFLLLITNAILLRFSRDLMFAYIKKRFISEHSTIKSPSTIESHSTESEPLLVQSDTPEIIVPKPELEISSTEPETTKVNPVEVSPELLLELTKIMEQDHFYREMDLSIGQLAVKLEVKEHHLRRVINSGLGYRNFNDFLNCYRIQETSARLSDPEIAKLPILTIALDAGFRSLSTFNKAFKDTHQLTPTEFRKKSLTIS